MLIPEGDLGLVTLSAIGGLLVLGIAYHTDLALERGERRCVVGATSIVDFFSFVDGAEGRTLMKVMITKQRVRKLGCEVGASRRRLQGVIFLLDVSQGRRSLGWARLWRAASQSAIALSEACRVHLRRGEGRVAGRGVQSLILEEPLLLGGHHYRDRLLGRERRLHVCVYERLLLLGWLRGVACVRVR